MAVRTRNLFISHRWSYPCFYNRIVALLRKRRYFRFKDYSVPRECAIHDARTDAELIAAIRRKMLPCSVVIITAGVHATKSKWMKKEIQIAQRLSKPILAVKPRGSKRTSVRVKDAADRIVKWNTESIVCGIRELS